MTTNNTEFAKELLIAAAFREFTAKQAMRIVEQVVSASTWPEAVVEQGAAVTIEQALNFFSHQLPEPHPVWITNGKLQR